MVKITRLIYFSALLVVVEMIGTGCHQVKGISEKNYGTEKITEITCQKEQKECSIDEASNETKEKKKTEESNGKREKKWMDTLSLPELPEGRYGENYIFFYNATYGKSIAVTFFDAESDIIIWEGENGRLLLGTEEDKPLDLRQFHLENSQWIEYYDNTYVLGDMAYDVILSSLDVYDATGKLVVKGGKLRDIAVRKREAAFVPHCYELVSANLTWEEAFAECISRGGYLAHIDSEEEWEVVVSQIEKENKGVICYFLGGKREECRHLYGWTDEKGHINYYSDLINGSNSWIRAHWLEGEPSLCSMNYTEDRIAMVYRRTEQAWYLNDVTDGILDDAPYLAGQMGYICEYEW